MSGMLYAEFPNRSNFCNPIFSFNFPQGSNGLEDFSFAADKSKKKVNNLNKL